MIYVLVTDSTIQSIGRLPNGARRLDTGEWVLGLDTAPPELVAATGWYEMVDTARPADTDTTTHDRSVELIDGTPTVTWTERAKTTDEQDEETRQANRATIDQAITDALTELRNLVAAPAMPTVPEGTMTTAQLSTAMRTLRDQAQQNRAGAQKVAAILLKTIRLVRGDFDDVN